MAILLENRSERFSKYRGVFRHKDNRSKPWQANISIDGKLQYLRLLCDRRRGSSEAHDAKAAKHGRKLNFPDEWVDVEDIEDITEEEEEEDDDDNNEDHEEFSSKRKRNGSSSKYRGVYRDIRDRSKPWRANFSMDKKRQYLGYYATEEEAARAFDAKAAKHGRKLNFPDEWKEAEDIEEEDNDREGEYHEVLHSKGKRKGSPPSIKECTDTKITDQSPGKRRSLLMGRGIPRLLCNRRGSSESARC